MFRRRDRRPWWEIIGRMIWPQGGWGRALGYMSHRIRRLPDSPERIGRGIWAGIFTSFTPFFGMHFLVAAGLARALRGNVLAALIATFVGNPLTYLPIAAVSLKTGNLILGRHDYAILPRALGGKFAGAWSDLWHNFIALFSSATTDWSRLAVFYDDIFLPFLVGGIGPGVLCGVAGYVLAVPVIRAYKARRRKMLATRWEKRLAARRAEPEETP